MENENLELLKSKIAVLEKQLILETREEEKFALKHKILEAEKVLATLESKQPQLNQNIEVKSPPTTISVPKKEEDIVVGYYHNFVKRFGLPVGIGKLTLEQVKRRKCSYKILRKSNTNTIRILEAINTKGDLTYEHEYSNHLMDNDEPKPPMRVCRWEFITDYTGQIVYEKASNKENKLIWTLVYAPFIKGMPRKAHYIDGEGFIYFPSQTNAEIIELTYSEFGYEILIKYYDSQINPHEIYSIKQKHNKCGLIIESNIFNKENTVFFTGRSYKKIRIYSELGYLFEESLFDCDGRPVLHEESNYHLKKFFWDNNGNHVGSAFFGLNKQPICTTFGHHSIKRIYDDCGNIIEVKYFDIEKHLVTIKDGYHKKELKYDDNGNHIEMLYFDISGKPVVDIKNTFHKRKTNYDKHNNLIETSFFGTDGKPVLIKSDFHKRMCHYDIYHNMIEEICYDIDLKPLLLEGSYYKAKFKYDKYGYIVEISIFGKENKAVIDKQGYHKLKTKYDNHHRLIENSCFDIYDQPTVAGEGSHKQIFEYDEYGDPINLKHLNTNGEEIDADKLLQKIKTKIRNGWRYFVRLWKNR